MYQWSVFVHLIGVFGFLAAHGVSMVVLFRLRRERDPKRVDGLLQLSGLSIPAFYAGFGLLLLGGVVAGFLGHWWSQGWIWGAIIILAVATAAMYGVASPYYRRLRVVSRAMAEGSQAVTAEQFDQVLGSARAGWIAGIGVVALGAILYLMLFKPTLGFSSSPVSPSGNPGSQGSAAAVQVVAKGIAFDTGALRVPASRSFALRFANEDGGVPHNVAVYKDSSATAVLFRGQIVTGPKVVTYRVGPLPAGTYYFQCDVHPQMHGTVEAR